MGFDYSVRNPAERNPDYVDVAPWEGTSGTQRWNVNAPHADYVAPQPFDVAGTYSMQPIGGETAGENMNVWNPSELYAPYITMQDAYESFGSGDTGGMQNNRYATFDRDRFVAEMSARNQQNEALWGSAQGWDRWGPKYFSEGIAKALGMSPREFNQWAKSVVGGQEIRNPFVYDRVLTDALIGARNLGGNTELMRMRNELEPQWQEAGDQWADTYHATTRGPRLEEIASAVLFALGPLSLGASMTGVPAAAAAGGGLAGSVLGAVAAPAQALGVPSGLASTVVNQAIRTGVKEGLSVDPSAPIPPVRVAGTSRAPVAPRPVSRVAAPEATQLSTSVIGPSVDPGTQTISSGLSAPSAGSDAGTPGQATSLSESVVDIAPTSNTSIPSAASRRPKVIRLTPGFMRGAG